MIAPELMIIFGIVTTIFAAVGLWVAGQIKAWFFAPPPKAQPVPVRVRHIDLSERQGR
jgi:hypothetical protein